MKRIFITILIVLLIFEILMFPKEAMYHAANGLTLWFDNMVPALFPFMVISSLAIRLNLTPYIASLFHPFLNKIYKTNLYCEYVIVMGFLCGFPMGAIIIRDLLSEQKINTKQAEFLLAFCNNIGPVFFSALVLPQFEKYDLLLLLGMYAIPLLYGIFLRYTFYKNAFQELNFCNHKAIVQQNQSYKTDNNEESFYHAFTAALNQSVSSILFLGACIIFFNMLRFLPAHFVADNLLLQTLISWFAEINGALILTGSLYDNECIVTSLCLLSLLHIGGMSCLCQTAGIISATNCSIKKYLLHKCLQSLFWFLFTLLWFLI